MGTWGFKPLDNDSALDLQRDFRESDDVAVLEKALDAVISLKDDQDLEAPDAEEAIAAVHILRELSDSQIKTDKKHELQKKGNEVLKRILKKSELKNLWGESPENDKWIQSVNELITE